jgi:hypothetical protein
MANPIADRRKSLRREKFFLHDRRYSQQFADTFSSRPTKILGNLLAPHLQPSGNMAQPTTGSRILIGAFGRRLEPLTPQGLLERIDGIPVTTSGQTWQVEVYSVSDEAGWRWVQLGLRGNPSYSLIVRTIPTEGIEHVLEALTKWLAKPSATERILDVA